MKRLIILSLTLVLLAGCGVYRKYERSELPAENLFLNSETQDTATIATIPWQEFFTDTHLRALIEQGLRQNTDFRVARLRVEAAEAVLRNARLAYLPAISLNPEASVSQFDGSRAKSYNLAVAANWEIDLFGSIRQRAKAKKELFRASRDEYNGTMVSLCAQVATAYMTLRTYQQQYIVAESNIQSQRSILHITEVRYETGLASQLDVSQAKTVYFNTKASLPSLEAGIEKQINIIAILLGKYPDELRPMLRTTKPLPDYQRLVGIGIPMNLLRRRPDVRQAERTVASYAASVGAAKSDFMPKLYLNGSIGFASRDMDHFFNKRSMTYQLAPTVSWPLFQGTQRIQALASAGAQLDSGIEQYNQIVLTAVQEVENAMNSYTHIVKQIAMLKELVAEGEKTLSLSLDLYKRGLSGFQNVLDAQRSLLSYQNSYVSAQGNAINALILLYQSLGGGWIDSSQP